MVLSLAWMQATGRWSPKGLRHLGLKVGTVPCFPLGRRKRFGMPGVLAHPWVHLAPFLPGFLGVTPPLSRAWAAFPFEDMRVEGKVVGWGSRPSVF